MPVTNFKNNSRFPVPLQVGDDVVMVPPGGEYSTYEPDQNANTYNPFPSDIVPDQNSVSANAFAAAAYQAPTGDPVEPGNAEIEDRKDIEEAPKAEVPQPRLAKGARTKSKENVND